MPTPMLRVKKRPPLKAGVIIVSVGKICLVGNREVARLVKERYFLMQRHVADKYLHGGNYLCREKAASDRYGCCKPGFQGLNSFSLQTGDRLHTVTRRSLTEQRFRSFCG